MLVQCMLWLQADLLTGIITLDDLGMITSSTLPPLYSSGECGRCSAMHTGALMLASGLK